MGQHKYNQTAIKAQKGELPPKPPKKSKRISERELNNAIMTAITAKIPSTRAIMDAIGENWRY